MVELINTVQGGVSDVAEDLLALVKDRRHAGESVSVCVEHAKHIRFVLFLTCPGGRFHFGGTWSGPAVACAAQILSVHMRQLQPATLSGVDVLYVMHDGSTTRPY